MSVETALNQLKIYLIFSILICNSKVHIYLHFCMLRITYYLNIKVRFFCADLPIWGSFLKSRTVGKISQKIENMCINNYRLEKPKYEVDIDLEFSNDNNQPRLLSLKSTKSVGDCAAVSLIGLKYLN